MHCIGEDGLPDILIYTASRSIRLFPLVWYRIQYMVLPTTISLLLPVCQRLGTEPSYLSTRT
jgi:hypothetical protein